MTNAPPIPNTTLSEHYDASGQAVEERNASGVTVTQYVWSVGDPGAMVLRDYDTGATPDGTLGQRLFALQDGRGNVSVIVDAGGDPEERYVYGTFGQVQVLTASGDVVSSYIDPADSPDKALGIYFVGARDAMLPGGTHFAWKYFAGDQRLDRISGLYETAGGGARDSHSNHVMQPDYSKICPYDPSHGGSYFFGMLPDSFASPTATVLEPVVRIGSFIGGPVVGVTANWIISGYERSLDGEDAWAATRHGFGDAVGYTSAYRGIHNEDPYTGQALNLGVGQRIFEGVVGVLQMTGLAVYGAGQFGRLGGLVPGVRFNLGYVMTAEGELVASGRLGITITRAPGLYGPGAFVGAGSDLGSWSGAILSVTGENATSVASFGESSGVGIKGPRSIAAQADGDLYHHIFLKYPGFRRWLVRYVENAASFNVNQYTVQIPRSLSEVIHASMRGVKGGWWEYELRQAILDEFSGLGRMLSHEELIAAGERVASRLTRQRYLGSSFECGHADG